MLFLVTLLAAADFVAPDFGLKCSANDLLPALSPAECKQYTNSSDVEAVLDQALAAANEGRFDRFQAYFFQARRALMCVDEPVGARLAGAMHLATGICESHGSTPQNPTGANPYLGAAAASRFPVPPSLAPELAPVLAASEPDPQFDRYSPAAGGRIFLDGVPATYARRPYVFQIVRRNGTAKPPVYVVPKAKRPGYDSLQVLLGAVAAGTATISTVSFVTAWLTEQKIRTEDWREHGENEARDVARAQYLNNGAFVVGVGSGGLALATTIWLSWTFDFRGRQ